MLRPRIINPVAVLLPRGRPPGRSDQGPVRHGRTPHMWHSPCQVPGRRDLCPEHIAWAREPAEGGHARQRTASL